MTAIGTKKTLRSGFTLEVTKVNPVSTFNAIKRELSKRGYVLDSCNTARTGSRYLEMHSNCMDIDVRCANHTYLSTAFSIGIDCFSPENRINSISIDLSAVDMTIAGFRLLMNEIDAINAGKLLEYTVDTYRRDGIEIVKINLEERGIPAIIISAVCKYLKDFVR